MGQPVPLTAGKFTLYATPKGGMHLSLLVDGEEEPRHVEIPAMMVKMMMRRAGSNGGFAAPDPYEIVGAVTLTDDHTIEEGIES